MWGEKVTGKIIPGLGCIERRLYVEAWLRKNVNFADPCLLCEKRPECVKTTVVFGEKEELRCSAPT